MSLESMALPESDRWRPAETLLSNTLFSCPILGTHIRFKSISNSSIGTGLLNR
jgi:hypothetical protein